MWRTNHLENVVQPKRNADPYLMSTMKAVVIHQTGGPEVLKLEDRPIPTPKSGWVLIRVRAFGLNRSELFTRQAERAVSARSGHRGGR